MADPVFEKHALHVEFIAIAATIILTFFNYAASPLFAPSLFMDIEKVYGKDGPSRSYIKFKNGTAVLIFSIISLVLVGVNAFSRNVIENLKNNYKQHDKTIELGVEFVPLGLNTLSLLLAIISFFQLINEKYVFVRVPAYLIIVTLIMAVAVRVGYCVSVKKILTKEVIQNKLGKSNAEPQQNTPSSNENVNIEVV